MQEFRELKYCSIMLNWRLVMSWFVISFIWLKNAHACETHRVYHNKRDKRVKYMSVIWLVRSSILFGKTHSQHFKSAHLFVAGKFYRNRSLHPMPHKRTYGLSCGREWGDFCPFLWRHIICCRVRQILWGELSNIHRFEKLNLSINPLKLSIFYWFFSTEVKPWVWEISKS